MLGKAAARSSSKDVDLSNRLAAVTRDDLNGACFPFTRPSGLFSDMTLVRLAQLSSFWANEKDGHFNALYETTRDLVAGLHGQSTSWVYVLWGSPGRIECWYGESNTVTPAKDVASLLRATFPDARVDLSQSRPSPDIDALTCGAVLTGIPSLQPCSEGEQIEKVCRGLYGGRWAYIVRAEPVSDAVVSQWLNDLTNEIKSAHATFLLKLSPVDEQNRLAQRYVELLEKKLARLEKGRMLGMWACRVSVYADTSALLMRAQALLHTAFSGENSTPEPVRICRTQSNVSKSPAASALTSAEVGVLASPPREEYPSYAVVDCVRFAVNGDLCGSFAKATAPQAEAVLLGNLLDRGTATGNTIGIFRKDLVKHALVTGVTGSGKTNTCLALLDAVWDSGRGRPFLVIEPAKSEYRALLGHPAFAGVRVFTVGDETISPLRINPFEVPPGILVQSHIDYLKSLFAAAFVLYPPMPYVLEQSIQEVYEDRGWNLARNTNSRGNRSHRCYPTLTDLARKIDVVVMRMGYDERLTMDIRAGLLARINQLRAGGGKALMLNTRHSLDASVIFDSPCILELKQIVSDEEKAFLMGLILIRLYEHHEAAATPTADGLRHLTLIEEAHRLLQNVSTAQGSDVAANPKGRAIEVFANIVSEIRAFGEGIVIAEQIPMKLVPDAIKNTNLKVVHRLLAEDDRKIIGNTMNLTDEQSRYLVGLRPGEAVVHAESIPRPILVSIPLVASKRSSTSAVTITADDVRTAMQPFWQQNGDALRPLTGCCRCLEKSNCSLCESVGAEAELTMGFRRLFNALVHQPSITSEAFSDFLVLTLENKYGYSGQRNVYCLLIHLADEEVERRAEYGGWGHDNVDQLVDILCGVLWFLATHQQATNAELLNQCLRELAAISDLIRHLSTKGSIMYPGCAICRRPCLHRFDVKRFRNEAASKDFRSAFMDLSVPMEHLAAISWREASRAYHAKDIASRRNAALCCAIQQLNGLDLTTDLQYEMAEKINSALRNCS
ncbi:MAG TPA: ATP-binding protein [Candidatus Hydrogenedentes bacterium]|nr:ATP-binding protein [Candidatus Hydrogenedentota bacterium]